MQKVRIVLILFSALFHAAAVAGCVYIVYDYSKHSYGEIAAIGLWLVFMGGAAVLSGGISWLLTFRAARWHSDATAIALAWGALAGLASFALTAIAIITLFPLIMFGPAAMIAIFAGALLVGPLLSPRIIIYERNFRQRADQRPSD